MCAVCECGMDTRRLSFSSTVVAIREPMAQRLSQSIKNVCAAQAQCRDLNFFGLKTNAKLSTNKLLFIQLEKSCATREERFVRWGWFHLPLWYPPLTDHQRHSNFWLEAIVDLSFFPLPRWVPTRICPLAIPLRRRFFLPDGAPTLTIFTAKYSGCCFTGRVWPSACLIFNLPKCIFPRKPV